MVAKSPKKNTNIRANWLYLASFTPVMEPLFSTDQTLRHHQALQTLLEQSYPPQLRQTVRSLLFRSLVPMKREPLNADQLRGIEVLLEFLEEL